MFCTNCGSENPDGATTCAACGAPLVDDAQQQPADFNDQPAYTVPDAPAPAKSKGPLIAIICGAVALIAIVLCLFLFVFNKHELKGKYKCTKISAMGMEITSDTAKAFGFDLSEFYLDFEGDEVEFMNGGESSGKVNFTLDGDQVTFTANGESITGTYDSGADKVTISESGASMEFEK